MPKSDDNSAPPIVFRLSVWTFLGFLGLGAHSQLAAAEELVFGFHGTQCPIVCDPEIDGQNGYILDILREIGHASGVKISLKTLPKTRLVRELQAGRVDFLLLPPSAIEKNDLLGTSLPVVNYAIGILRRRDFSFEFKGVESLKEVVWGVVSGERWRPAYQRHIEANRNKSVVEVFGARPFERLIKMATRNRVDVVIGLYDMLERKRLASASPDKLTVERTMVFGEHVPIFLAFSPADHRAQSRANVFSAGIRRLERSGRLEKILASYGVGEWAQVRISSFKD